MSQAIHTGASLETAPPAHTHGGRRFRLPLIYLLGMLILLAAYAAVSAGTSPAVIWPCLILQYALMISALRRPLEIASARPTFVTAEFLFLFFSYLIFFYPYQLNVLGLYDVTQSRFFTGDTFGAQSNQAIVLSALGVLAFVAGIRSLPVPRQVAPSEVRTHRLDTVTAEDIAFPVFALQAILFATYLLSGLRAASEGRYSDTTVGGPIAEGIYLGITVLSMVALAMWALPSGGQRRPVFLWFALILSVVWGVRILLAGDRNSFMLLAITAIGGFFTFRWRGGRWALVPMCAVAIVLYSVIEQFRSGQIGSLLDYFQEGAGTVGSSADTSFNISTVSVRAALANVPGHFDYGYGFYQLVGFAGIIPFIRGILIPPDATFTQSSDVLSSILLGPRPTWSVGSNVIVDIYVDFGVFGVPLLLFGLGVFVAFTQIAVARMPQSLWRSVFYLMTLALAAEIPRYAFSFPVRPLVWALGLFWVVSMIGPALQSRRAATGPMVAAS